MLFRSGLARFFEAGKDNVTERFDEQNAILGTADYLAPEQARGETVDIRADIYSLGATFYFLLTGKAPFEEGSVTQKLLWSQTKAPKPIGERRADVPEELTAVINKMMAKDANDRYQTPQALVEALAPWTQTPVPPPAADEMPRRSLACVAPGAPSQVPLLPSTPAPRTLANGLPSGRSGPLAAVKPPGPKTPAPRPAGPATPMPSTGPRSKRLPAVEREPEPPRPEPRRRRPRQKGLPKWAIFAAAGTGAVLVIVGLLGAYLYNKARRSQSTETVTNRPPAIVLPDQAGNYIGQSCTVEMTAVRATKDRAGNKFFLNTKPKNADPGNLTVTWSKKVMDQLAQKGIPNIESLKNKTVRVTGTVTTNQNRPQIVIESADQIQLVSK